MASKAKPNSNNGSKASLLKSLSGNGSQSQSKSNLTSTSRKTSLALNAEQAASVVDAILLNGEPSPEEKAAKELELQAAELAKAEFEREEKQLILEAQELKQRIEALPIPYHLLKKGLSCIGMCPNGLRHVFHRLCLPNERLLDIGFLKNYTYLQKLELPGNGVEDVSIINSLPYLVSVDLSNNAIKSFKLTSPPRNLQFLDLSRNKLEAIDDFSNYRFLKSIALDHNHISEIDGLKDCGILNHLYISHNSISRISGLDFLPLTHLDVSNNVLESMNGLSTLKNLIYLNLSHNIIDSVSAHDDWNPENHPVLSHLDLSENTISDTEELSSLACMTLLRNLNLSGNPVTQNQFDFGEYSRAYSTETLDAISTQNSVSNGNDYRVHMYYAMPHLTCLDNFPITAEEKTGSLNRFQPPRQVVDTVQHATLAQKKFKLYAKIKYKEPGLLVVICGPAGAGKSSLTSRLLKDYPQLFGSAISHTTRKPRPGEVDGVNYHFISRSDMKRMQSRNRFLEVAEVMGNIYAITFEAVEDVFSDGKVCVLDLEIEKHHLNLKIVYVTVASIEILKARLKNVNPLNAGVGSASSSQEDLTLSRLTTKRQLELFSTMHKYQQRESKENYDFKIVNDDFEESYLALKKRMLCWFTERIQDE